MTLCSAQYCCPAATLAKSLLEVWLSGDPRRLRLELECVSMAPVPPEKDDEWDRIELLKSIAWRMRDAADLFTPPCESPRTATWLDLLDHLSVSALPVN